MRIQVNLSDEMVEKVDSYASKMGVNRSALCAVIIGQGILTYDKSFEVVESVGEKIGQEVSEKVRNAGA